MNIISNRLSRKTLELGYKTNILPNTITQKVWPKLNKITRRRRCRDVGSEWPKVSKKYLKNGITQKVLKKVRFCSKKYFKKEEITLKVKVTQKSEFTLKHAQKSKFTKKKRYSKKLFQKVNLQLFFFSFLLNHLSYSTIYSNSRDAE